MFLIPLPWEMAQYIHPLYPTFDFIQLWKIIPEPMSKILACPTSPLGKPQGTHKEHRVYTGDTN